MSHFLTSLGWERDVHVPIVLALSLPPSLSATLAPLMSPVCLSLDGPVLNQEREGPTVILAATSTLACILHVHVYTCLGMTMSSKFMYVHTQEMVFCHVITYMYMKKSSAQCQKKNVQTLDSCFGNTCTCTYMYTHSSVMYSTSVGQLSLWLLFCSFMITPSLWGRSVDFWRFVWLHKCVFVCAIRLAVQASSGAGQFTDNDVFSGLQVKLTKSDRRSVATYLLRRIAMQHCRKKWSK